MDIPRKTQREDADSAPIFPECPLLLKVPAQLADMMEQFGATVVEERRSGTVTKLYIQLPDEAERRERQKVGLASEGDNEYLARLDRARDVLVDDERLRRFLITSDWLAWPSVKEMRAMLDLCVVERETRNPPDFAGAMALKEAMATVEAEAVFPGLHPLVEHSVEGEVVLYAPVTELATPCSSGADGGVPGALVRSDLDKRTPSGPAHAMARLLHTLGGTCAPLSTEEVLRMPLTPAVQKQVTDRIAAAAQQQPKTWKELFAVHSSAPCAPLFFSIAEFAQQLHMAAERAVCAVAEAGRNSRRVRLRCGVYMALVEYPEMFVVCRRGGLAGLTVGERMALEECVQRSLDELHAAGMLLGELNMNKARERVAKQYLSPLLRLDSDAVRWEQVAQLSADATLFRVTLSGNVFGVVHGPRVAGSALPNLQEKSQLSDLLSSREATEDELAQRSRTWGGGSQGRGAPSSPLSVTSSTVLTGEELRRQLDSAVTSIIAQEPLCKALLKAHPGLRRWATYENFDTLLRDSLRRNAEYRSRRYYLKEA